MAADRKTSGTKLSPQALHGSDLPLPPANHSKQEEANRVLVDKFYALHEAGDDKRLLELLTDDCVYCIGVGTSEDTVPYHGIYRGKAQIAAYLAKKRRLTLRPFCGLLTRALVDGPFVICIGEVEDEFHTSRYRIHKCRFMQFFIVNESENKISRMEYFVDTAATQAAWLAAMDRGVTADTA